jgi:hypothetical protein
MFHKQLVGLDLEDLTPKQLRALLRGAARHSILNSQKDEKEADDSADEEASENDDLVNLHEEHKGDSRPPKVTKDDLPKGVTMPEEEDEEEVQIASKKGKK